MNRSTDDSLLGVQSEGELPAFLQGGGTMGALMRGHDWSTSPLGDPACWPESLRAVVALMINSKYPMFIAWGPQLAFLYNDGYIPIFGAKHPEALGLPFKQVWPEIWDDIWPLIDKALHGEATFNEDLHLVMERHGYPEDTWYSFSYSPLRDESGVVAGMFCACTETTQKVLAERGLRESEARFRAAFEDAAVGMVEVDSGWNIIGANDAYARITGRPIDQLIGQSCLSFTHTDDIANSEDALHAAARGESVAFEKRYVRPDGEPIWIRSNLTRVTGTGETARFVKIIENIDDRIAAQTALRESEERFRNMADHSPVMMWVTEPDGHCSYLNRAWYDFTGQQPGEAEGFGWLDAVHPDDRGWSGESFLKANEEHSDFRIEYRLRRHDGEYRWAIDAASPRYGSDGQFLGFIGSVIDIHERKREEALRAAENRVLELAITDQPLAETLEQLVEFIEQESDGQVLASILLLDPEKKRLLHGAAPSLPDAYNAAIHGVEIGEGVGSCGTAAHSGKPVYVSDIAGDPLWKDFKDLAIGHGLRACWSIPILSGSGGVLGTFAMYYRQPREPNDEDLRLVGTVTRAASLIIERKLAEEALRERSEEFFALADNIPALAWMAYADGHIFWYNRRWYEFTGTSAETQQGWGWESVHDPERLPAVVERWNHSLATGEPFEMTFPLKGADGIFRPFLTRVVPIRDESGTIVRWFGTNVDVSDQVEAERRLREQRQNLETLNRVGSSIAAELELEAVVQLATDAGVELTGAQFGAFFYNVTGDHGESYMLYTLSGAHRSQFEDFGMPRNTAVFGPTFAGEGVVRSDDITKDPRYGKNAPHRGMPEGHLPVVSYLAVPVRSRSGEVIGGLFFGHPEPGQFTEAHERLMVAIAGQAAVAMDNARLYRAAQQEIDRRLKAEQALTVLNENLESRVAEEVARNAQSEEALRHLQKMETIGQLSGGIAHDFNNLLQIIQGNLSLLKRLVGENDPRALRSVEHALIGTERAAALTQRLLAFSRRQPLDPRAIDVNRLIDLMTDLLHRTLGETIVVETDLSKDSAVALVDGNQLENALLNLAINARDAMPNGGRLSISTDLADLDAEQAGEAPPGRYIRINVSDTGEGMDSDVLARAIEPFFSTKEVGQGTGLGLSMVYGFVRQSGGNLTLQSTPGEGTSIDLYLPVSDETPTSRDRPSARGELPRGKGECILLCEDDADVRTFSGETLRELGYDVVESVDAETALAELKRNERIELLFTDIILPGGRTGADLAIDARKARPGIKVLFTTGYARSALDSEQSGSLDLLLKPFTVEDLAVKLRETLDSE